MENEVKEVLDEEQVNKLGKVNPKAVIGTILGIVTVTATTLLFKFKNKINTKIEGNMVKKLVKKGYTVQSPEFDESIILDEAK